MPTPPEEQERIKSVYAKQAAALRKPSFQDWMTEAANEYFQRHEPELYAAFYGHEPCHDKLANCIAGLVGDCIGKADHYVGQFVASSADRVIYDDREYRADQKVA